MEAEAVEVVVEAEAVAEAVAVAEVEVVVGVVEYQPHHQVEVEAEDAPPEDHHPQLEDLKETLLSNSQEIENKAKPSYWHSKSIKE